MALRKIFYGDHTIDAAMRNGFTSGFDYLRIFLSVAVLIWHSATVGLGADFAKELFADHLRGLVSLILPCFFALSGFLVAGSLLRTTSLVEFAALRGIRLVPALFVEVVLSALILGPIVTSVTLSRYFADQTFFEYFGNMVGRIRMHLPGVFVGMPAGDVVNASLWTLPYELECYVVLGLLALLGLHRRPYVFLLSAVTANVGLFLLSHWTQTDYTDRPPGRMLVASFLFGVVLHLFKQRIRLSPAMFAVCLAATFAFLSFQQTAYLAPAFAAYATVYIGLKNPPKLSFLKRNDLSYGIYLYAFPIQQTVAFSFPSLNSWWFNVVLALPITCLFAYVSWNFVEAPFMSNKKRILSVLKRFDGRIGQPAIGLEEKL